MRSLFYFTILLGCFIQCKNTTNNSSSTSILENISCDTGEGGMSNFFVSESGQLYLSWISFKTDSLDALMFSYLEDGEWSTPKMIAQGEDWFVNWADFPSLVAYPTEGEQLAAHWLQKSAAGTYDYDIRIAQSPDGGNNWSNSFIPHQDKVNAEHGFVSMLPIAPDRIFATWLDGRQTKTEPSTENSDHGQIHHHNHGAMTLRTALFDPNDQLYQEEELDDRVCDCCPTSAALTSNGPIVVYRDRSEKDVRDIYISRQVNGEWTTPQAVYNDQWTIKSCPVNGPVAVAKYDQVAVAWYTEAKKQAQVKIAFSDDAGANFDAPFIVSDHAPLGRVDLTLWEGKVIVTWLEKEEDEAKIQMAIYNKSGQLEDTKTLTNTLATHQSGFPKTASINGQVYLTWTVVDGEKTNIKTAKINL